MNQSEIVKKLCDFRDRRRWGQFHTPKNLAVSVSIEASELLEIFQWKADGYLLTDQDKEKVKDELADVYIYLLLLAECIGVDLLVEANNKIERNERRFPVSETSAKSNSGV